jgi:hypothetical protein
MTRALKQDVFKRFKPLTFQRSQDLYPAARNPLRPQ